MTDEDEVYVDIPIGYGSHLRFATVGGSVKEGEVTKTSVDLLFMVINENGDEQAASHFTVDAHQARRIARKILFTLQMLEDLDDKPPHHFEHG